MKIAGLRVVQLPPKTNAPRSNPRIGVAGDANVRLVLGAVPVETDGSAYFEIPAGKPVYFQALDGRGLAVQSMRSVTYLQPGERLTCRGCHEPRRPAPPLRAAPPIAARGARHRRCNARPKARTRSTMSGLSNRCSTDMTLRLDCNSDFLGACHDVEEQRLGMLVYPKLE